jgi:hypothetical protein
MANDKSWYSSKLPDLRVVFLRNLVILTDGRPTKMNKNLANIKFVYHST